MYYSTFEPYNEPELTNQLCLICWEPDIWISPFYSVYGYRRTCKCMGNFHMNCIEQWMELNKSCPICRSEILPNINYVLVANEHYLKNIQLD